ncbi:MAG TPA: AAA family ATPase [Opitutaceae bacterium]|nr:AAA family ATPase [Opitutaceae bacterium]
MIFLRNIERVVDVAGGSGFPFDLPPINGFRRLELTSPVTFFVGENGTGKSSLLEAIGLRAKLTCAAGKPLEHDAALIPIHPLARSLRLTWAPQTRHGFFLRVEDYFAHARENRTRSKPTPAISFSGPDAGRMTVGLREPDSANGEEELGQSPGESFLAFVQTHCTPGGLHLIDEPEAVLSPQRQLAFMSLLKSVVGENAQFIIATHSPILLAFPGAQILSFDDGNISQVAYEELPHVCFTKKFLNDPEAYLRNL